ncbi:MAG: ABC transporter, partial [Desulfohalobiaceae bacterium]
MEIKTLSRLGRFKDIVVILVRYGFVDILERLDLPSGLVPKRLEQASRESTWVRIRKAMEELGPTFIKVGQILSLRTDLIPL